MKHHDLMEGLMGGPVFPVQKGYRSDPAWSVRNSLKILLNTRRGSLPHIPDYGLPDVSEIYKDFPDSIASLRQAISETIRKFEPRLTDIDVQLENRDDMELVRDIMRNPRKRSEGGNNVDRIFRATYLVTARLKTDYRNMSIEFRTNIHSDGNIEII